MVVSEFALYGLPLIGFIFFVYKRLLSYLHFFQQEEYNPKRFLVWYVKKLAFDKRASFVIILMMLAIQIFSFPPLQAQILVGLFLMGFGFKELNPKTQGKKPLVMTNRAKRIYVTACALLLICLGLTIYYIRQDWMWLIPLHFIPFTLPIAVLLMQPFDLRVNKKFRDEAVQKLADIDPFVIGITGSFGKTSVKHMLGHILQSYAPTIMTPGSVNTEMGITRIIREQLQPHHKYFIVEMGAYGIGSIARLCRLTPPKLSVLTAVGAAHYERFKTLEDTARAKFEIAEAADKMGGKTVIHASVLERTYAQDYVTAHPEQVIICGEGQEVSLTSATQTAKGIALKIKDGKKTHSVTAPIYGLHHAGNVMIAYTAAKALGMKPLDIIAAIKTMPQVHHRLEVKSAGQYTIIDDAYNSNPIGFAAGLDLLDILAKKSGGRRILITPGMVEMGSEHKSAHEKIAMQASQLVDIAIVVKSERIPSFVNTYIENATPEKILMKANSFKQAEHWLNENAKAGDTVLIENDLPDLYERKILF